MAFKKRRNSPRSTRDWNKRNFPGVIKNAAEGLVYTGQCSRHYIEQPAQIPGMDRKNGPRPFQMAYHQT